MDHDEPSLDDLLKEAGINTIQRNLSMVFNNANSAAMMLVARNMAVDMTMAQDLLRKTCEDVLLETAITDAHQHVNLLFKNRNTSSASRFLALTYPESSIQELSMSTQHLQISSTLFGGFHFRSPWRWTL